MKEPKAWEQYRHFKGGKYQIICLAQKEDTGETLVIYQALYGDCRIFARTLDNFTEKLDRNQYPEAQQTYRFERIGEEAAAPPQSVADAAAPPTQSAADAAAAAPTQSVASAAETVVSENVESDLDPLMEQFLDAELVQDRIEILQQLRPHLTDQMIDTMAMAAGVEIGEGSLDERYDDLQQCLRTIDRYEMERERLR
jgi:hypothetical protein